MVYLVQSCILALLEEIGRWASQNDRLSLEHSPPVPESPLSLAPACIAEASYTADSMSNQIVKFVVRRLVFRGRKVIRQIRLKNMTV